MKHITNTPKIAAWVVRIAIVLIFFAPVRVLSQLPTSSTSKITDLSKKREYDEALDYLKSLEENHTGNIEKAHISLLRAAIYFRAEKTLRAETTLDSLLALNIFKEYPKLLAKTWLEKALILSRNNNAATAIQYYHKIDSLGDKIKTIPENQIHALNGMGTLSFSYIASGLGFSKPRDHYEKALKIASKINDSTLWYTTKIKLEFLTQGNPNNKTTTLSPVFEKAKQHFIAHNEYGMLYNAIEDQIKIYTYIIKDFGKVEQLLKELVELTKGDNYLQTIAYKKYGDYYYSQNNYPEAIKKFKTALSIAKDTKYYNKIQYIQMLLKLSELLKKEGRYQEALAYAEERYNIADSINKFKGFEIAKHWDAKYQTEKKEQEIALLSAQNKLSEQKNKNQKALYGGLTGLLLATGGFLFFGYRNKIKTAQKFKELNQLKSRFFANISHEFRTPLTLIKSPVQKLQTTANAPEQKQLSLIDHNANRMLELVDQLLELSKIESGNLKIILKQGNISSFLNTLVSPFAFKAKEEKTPFETAIEPLDKPHYFDRDILTKIVVNLLSNAFKYSDKGKPVGFKSKIKGEQLHLEVGNYNNELSESDIRKLFDRFYQNNTTASGYGIGLALVKDLVELCEGSINASLHNGKVSFAIELPLRKTLKNAVVIEQETEQKTTAATSVSDIENETDEKPIMLIADDNANIRSVLNDLFKDDFKIVQAKDGKEAYQTAQNQIPDCIITDVMMPKMDGFNLVKKLKENELTSSVPVVLLTAKSGEDSRLQGLQSHADAYLTKPFNHNIVREKVKQLLYERQKLKERYSKELVLKPTEVAITTADEQFINRLQEVLETNLANSEFTIETFAKKMTLSRMQLHRKLKSLLGVSATEYLRSERIKTAAKLLGNKKLTVSDVAYNVGFNNLNYFSKNFKETYGLSPSAFRKKKG